MFFNAPPKPTRLKRVIYLFASTILGILLSFIIHALLEINYLHWVGRQNLIIASSGGCFLPTALRIGLFIFGAIGGFFLGRYWWRKVYIERIWAKKC